MRTTYRIHPGVGIARLGNSPGAFYISPETPAALPIDCGPDGNPLAAKDGTEARVTKFRDEEGRVKRQAARFQVYVYDDESPEGRPLCMGDVVEGGGNRGTLTDIHWRVWLANKKAAWYEFHQLEGEHGYAPGHRRRNADVTDPQARKRLIIDPGPRVVDCTRNRRASCGRDSGGTYATTFPRRLEPACIDTLGDLLTDDAGRLLVLGGHGHSGSWMYKKFGQPRIDHYANNDGWFDDTSDGPVMARLVFTNALTQGTSYLDVEAPAWVICGYPRFVPEILDMITADEVIQDLAIRQFAARTDLYGQSGTFSHPQRVDVSDPEALALWRDGRLQWNPEHRPWFYRDVWTILFRPDQYSYLTDILGLSNYPHNQSTRGTFDPLKLGRPPAVDRAAVRRGETALLERLRSGALLAEALAPALDLLRSELQAAGAGGGDEKAAAPPADLLSGDALKGLAAAAARYVAAVTAGGARGAGAGGAGAVQGTPDGTADALSDAAAGAGTTATDTTRRDAAADAPAPRTGTEAPDAGDGELDGVLAALRQAADRPELAAARAELDDAAGALLAGLPGYHAGVREAVPAATIPGAGGQAERVAAEVEDTLRGHVRALRTGHLLEEARRRLVEAHTADPYRAMRRFLFDLLRPPGDENHFFAGGRPDGRTHNLPLMPLLAGDNPLSNTLPSKFLRLTDHQYFILRQWSLGLFYNEAREGWPYPDPTDPWRERVNRTPGDLDRGVLSNVLGGAFCPGGEVGWVIRNPAIWAAPYRINADPGFALFENTAAQLSQGVSVASNSYIQNQLSQKNDFRKGLQPGDLTKYMSVPWQADFNECSTETFDVTYDGWNEIYPRSDRDPVMKREQKKWETLWWPAHRPMQVFYPPAGGSPSYPWGAWSPGIPQTREGDLMMVTEWARLGFVVRNRGGIVVPSTSPPPQPPPYVTREALGELPPDPE